LIRGVHEAREGDDPGMYLSIRVLVKWIGRKR
jgi:hypothetical protein